MPRTPEGSVKADIKKFLDDLAEKGELYYFMPVQTGYGRRTVDFLVCYGGKFIAIEAKRQGGRARRFQQKILNHIATTGGFGWTIDNVEDLKQKFVWYLS